MFRRTRLAGLALAIAVSVTLPASHEAAADDAGTSPASVQDVTMMVDAMLNGKDVWSPGGRELNWAASKCPYKIQFKGQVQVDKPTKITYRWERSDGTQLPTQTFDVKTAGTVVDVTPPDSWGVGMPGRLFKGAETFHVLTPSDLSTSTPIKVECGG